MNILKSLKLSQKKHKSRKPHIIRQALCLVSILSLIILQAGNLVFRPVPVYADGAVAPNVAGYILTLLTSYNTAIVNQNVVNAVVNTFGSMECASANAAQIETGLATIASQTGFDLAPIFATSAQEAAEVAAVYADWGETAIAAASAGTNIEAGAKGLALAAAGGAGAAVMPAIGGVVLPAAAAVALGVAGGFLINHIRNKITDYVKGGFKLNENKSVMNAHPSGTNAILYNNSQDYWFIYPSNASGAIYGNTLYLKNYGATGFYGWQWLENNGDGESHGYDYLYRNELKEININDNNFPRQAFPIFNSEQAAKDYLNGRQIGTNPNNMSPDIIGNQGNQTGYNDNGTYRIPNIQPIYQYGDTYVTYIDPSDYQDLVTQANTNTGDGDVDEETQGQDFDTITDPYVQPVGQPDPGPDPQPTGQPDPVPTTMPWEEVDPVPSPQPTVKPLPDPTTSEQEQLPEGMTQPDWKEKFPFCIPFDLLAFMQMWQEAREAPVLTFDLSFGTQGRYGDGIVVIDLNPFNSAAQLLRLLQLILFIVGLALGTHKLLNPSGGGGD